MAVKWQVIAVPPGEHEFVLLTRRLFDSRADAIDYLSMCGDTIQATALVFQHINPKYEYNRPWRFFSEAEAADYYTGPEPNSGWERHPDYGELMTISEFVTGVEIGMYTDSDGYGYLSDGAFMCRHEEVTPSDVKDCRLECAPSYTHVMWFNK